MGRRTARAGAVVRRPIRARAIERSGGGCGIPEDQRHGVGFVVGRRSIRRAHCGASSRFHGARRTHARARTGRQQRRVRARRRRPPPVAAVPRSVAARVRLADADARIVARDVRGVRHRSDAVRLRRVAKRAVALRDRRDRLWIVHAHRRRCGTRTVARRARVVIDGVDARPGTGDWPGVLAVRGLRRRSGGRHPERRHLAAALRRRSRGRRPCRAGRRGAARRHRRHASWRGAAGSRLERGLRLAADTNDRRGALQSSVPQLHRDRPSWRCRDALDGHRRAADDRRAARAAPSRQPRSRRPARDGCGTDDPWHQTGDDRRGGERRSVAGRGDRQCLHAPHRPDVESPPGVRAAQCARRDARTAALAVDCRVARIRSHRRPCRSRSGPVDATCHRPAFCGLAAAIDRGCRRHAHRAVHRRPCDADRDRIRCDERLPRAGAAHRIARLDADDFVAARRARPPSAGRRAGRARCRAALGGRSDGEQHRQALGGQARIRSGSSADIQRRADRLALRPARVARRLRLAARGARQHDARRSWHRSVVNDSIHRTTRRQYHRDRGARACGGRDVDDRRSTIRLAGLRRGDAHSAAQRPVPRLRRRHAQRTDDGDQPDDGGAVLWRRESA